LASSPRVSGILILVILIVAGMGAGSVVYQLKAPGIVRDMNAARGSVPSDPEERVVKWLEFGRGLAHKRLVQLRLSSARPWLVTHVIEVSDDPATHEIWGLDLTDLPVEVTQAEGMRVVVSLPGPKLLGHGAISGDKSLHVPRHRPGETVAEPGARAEWMAEWALERLTEALEKDIEGATLEVRAGDRARDGAEVGDGAGDTEGER
jgi:hypothetical protein